MDVQAYWAAVAAQDANRMAPFFHKDAVIRWHNTNEQFTVAEFLRANCEYPGTWQGEVERIEQLDDTVISVVRVLSAESGESHHAVSFLTLRDGKIAAMDEYWGEDGPAPQWRREKAIGTAILLNR